MMSCGILAALSQHREISHTIFHTSAFAASPARGHPPHQGDFLVIKGDAGHKRSAIISRNANDFGYAKVADEGRLILEN